MCIAPDVLPGADSWQYGYVLSLGLVNETSDTRFTASTGGQSAAATETTHKKIEEHTLPGKDELLRGRF